MKLDEIEKLARSIVLGWHSEVEAKMSCALLLLLPVIRAAETYRDRDCTGEFKHCRETVDDHDRDCPFNTTEVALENAIDKLREVVGK